MHILADSAEAAEFALGDVELTTHSIEELDADRTALWQCTRSTQPVDHLLFGDSASAAGGIRLVTVANEARGSQLDALTNWLREGGSLPDGAATVALAGTRFHGQHNRAWEAHHGNLHLCLVFHPNVPADSIGAGLTMVPSVAVTDAIREVAGMEPPARIKWINDVCIQRNKVAGVLSTSQLTGSTVASVVFGIGVNVAVAPPIPATPHAPRVGCLNQAYDRSFALPDILLPLLRAVDRRYRALLEEGPAPLLRDYSMRLDGIGDAVQIVPEAEGKDQPVITGIFEGIHSDLSLRISGQAEPIRTGRLVIAEDGATG